MKINRNASTGVCYHLVIIAERGDTYQSFATVDELVRALDEADARKDVLTRYCFIGQRLLPQRTTHARYNLISADDDKTFASIDLPP